MTRILKEINDVIQRDDVFAKDFGENDVVAAAVVADVAVDVVVFLNVSAIENNHRFLVAD
jgi:hypothetical protein